MTEIIGFFHDTSTVPSISVRFEYEYKTENGKIYYRIAAIIGTLPERTYFPYNLKVDISVWGKKVVTGGVLKQASPKYWNEEIVTYFPARTGWFELDSAVMPYIFESRVYSTQTSGTADGNGMIYFPSGSSQDHVKIKINNTWYSASKVYIKTGGVWKQSKKIYIKIGGMWKEV